MHERVRARFPELVVPDGHGGTTHELPTGGPLTKALRDAGFELSLSMHERDGIAALPADAGGRRLQLPHDGRVAAVHRVRAR